MKNRLITSAYFALFLCVLWMLLFGMYLGVYGFKADFPFAFSCVFAVAHAGEFALGALLMALLLSFLPRRLWGLLCVLLGTGATLFLLADFFVYRQFKLHIDMAMLSMFFGSAGSDIFVFPPIMYAQAGLCALVALTLATMFWSSASRLTARLRRKPWEKPGSTPWLKCSYIFIFICIFMFHGIHAWASFNMYAPVTSQASALPLVQPLSLNGALKKLGFKPASDLPRFTVKNLNYPLAEMRFAKPEKQLNLVVIMLDGWRFDCLNEEVAPHIYEFSRLSQRFNRHNAGSNHTRHGVYSFFYGLPGLYWPPTLIDRVSPVLMNAMIESGYSTGIFGSSSLASPEFDQTVFVRAPGVDLLTEGEEPEDKDRTITDKFLHFMDERDKAAPFFSFLFYDAPHAYRYDAEIAPPRFLPEESKNYLSGGDREKLRMVLNRYKNSVFYDDLLVKRVLDRLRDEDLLENTVVIITSDHGEEFDDLGLGYSGHNGNFSRYQVQVPMLIYWPGLEAVDHDYQTSHLDLAPTLMRGLFGCLNPAEDYSAGTDLFSPGPRDYVFMMGPSGSYGIQVDDFITVFPQLGPSYTVTAGDYRPSDWRMPAELYRRILHDLSRFKQ